MALRHRDEAHRLPPRDGLHVGQVQSLEDQLERADARSWQIADRYAMASSAARGVAVFDFRVRFAVEPQLILMSSNYALPETGADRTL